MNKRGNDLTLERMEQLFQKVKESVRLPWYKHEANKIKAALGMKLTPDEWNDLELFK